MVNDNQNHVFLNFDPEASGIRVLAVREDFGLSLEIR